MAHWTCCCTATSGSPVYLFCFPGHMLFQKLGIADPDYALLVAHPQSFLAAVPSLRSFLCPGFWNPLCNLLVNVHIPVSTLPPLPFCLRSLCAYKQPSSALPPRLSSSLALISSFWLAALAWSRISLPRSLRILKLKPFGRGGGCSNLWEEMSKINIKSISYQL